MRTQELQFKYKGERDYVHGTDMYQEISKLIKQVDSGAADGDFRMAIHDIVRSQCRLLYSEWTDGIVKPEGSKVEFSFTSGPKRLIGWLVPTADPVVDRYSYQEQAIVEQCLIENEEAVVSGKLPYSAIEVLVAANKHLHLKTLPEAQGKWFFTRLELERLLEPENVFEFRLKIMQNMHNRLTKSLILADGRAAGHIYFSLVK